MTRRDENEKTTAYNETKGRGDQSMWRQKDEKSDWKETKGLDDLSSMRQKDEAG
jgi:hypothetical protein